MLLQASVARTLGAERGEATDEEMPHDLEKEESFLVEPEPEPAPPVHDDGGASAMDATTVWYDAVDGPAEAESAAAAAASAGDSLAALKQRIVAATEAHEFQKLPALAEQALAVIARKEASPAAAAAEARRHRRSRDLGRSRGHAAAPPSPAGSEPRPQLKVGGERRRRGPLESQVVARKIGWLRQVLRRRARNALGTATY
jgi:hypothetical protein